MKIRVKTFLILFVILVVFFGMPCFSYDPVSINQMFENKTFVSDIGSIKYRVYVPDDYLSRSYPIILFLHGSGQRGGDNTSQLEGGIVPWMFSDKNYCMDYPAIVVAPQCPEDEQWVNTPWVDGSYDSEKIPESNAAALAFELTNACAAAYNADASRIYITGISMGGYGTWDMITRHSGYFAAAVPICGAGDPSAAGKIGNCRVLAYHGDSDITVPVSGTLDMCRALADTDTKYSVVIMENYGHFIWDDIYDKEDVYKFMFSDIAPLSAQNDVSEICESYHIPNEANTDEKNISDAEVSKVTPKAVVAVAIASCAAVGVLTYFLYKKGIGHSR